LILPQALFEKKYWSSLKNHTNIFLLVEEHFTVQLYIRRRQYDIEETFTGILYRFIDVVFANKCNRHGPNPL